MRMDFRHDETFDETLQHVIKAVKPYKDTLWNVWSASDNKPPSPRTWRAIFWLAATALRVSRAAAMVTMNVGSIRRGASGLRTGPPRVSGGDGSNRKVCGIPAPDQLLPRWRSLCGRAFGSGSSRLKWSTGILPASVPNWRKQRSASATPPVAAEMQ